MRLPRGLRPLSLLLGVPLVWAMAATPTPAQRDVDRARGFVERRLTVPDGPLAGREVRYRLLVPKGRRLGEKFPVVLFLHGAGERGDDNLAQLRHFPERMTLEPAMQRFRCIVIAPQVPRGARWVEVDWSAREPQTGPSPWLDVALAALDKTLADENADPQRVYLTGLSMGGFGSWHLAAKAPERFAAVAPVCGGGDPDDAGRFRDLPIWAWHGAEDPVVHPDQTRRMVDAARSGGALALYTELPSTGHDSWNAAYALDSGLLAWMFARRKDRPDLGVVMACDQSGPRLRLMDVQRGDWNESAAELWGWSPQDADLPEEHVAWFSHPTDAKPIVRGTVLLGTASGGAVFQLRLADRALQWYAKAGANPHSVSWVPGRGAVVASSTDDRLAWFRIGGPPEAPPQQVLELTDAHGVHWDAAAETLWALGGKELLQLAFADEQLTVRARHPLPETETARGAPRHGGHDLIALRGSAGLAISDLDRLWTFDPQAARFAPLPAVAEYAAVKSLAELRPGGPWLLMAATEEWWSDTGRLVGLPEPPPAPTEIDPELLRPTEAVGSAKLDPTLRTLDGARFYKLRAWQ